MAAKETAAQKALRLVAEGRVRLTALTSDTCAAVVEGDTLDQFGERPRYETSLRGRWQCSCPHGSMSRALCSHALAAQMIYRAARPALEGGTGERVDSGISEGSVGQVPTANRQSTRFQRPKRAGLREASALHRNAERVLRG